MQLHEGCYGIEHFRPSSNGLLPPRSISFSITLLVLSSLPPTLLVQRNSMVENGADCRQNSTPLMVSGFFSSTTLNPSSPDSRFQRMSSGFSIYRQLSRLRSRFGLARFSAAIYDNTSRSLLINVVS